MKQSRYQKYREAGLCGRCGKCKPEKGKARCTTCLGESVRHNREWSENNREADNERKRLWAQKKREAEKASKKNQ